MGEQQKVEILKQVMGGARLIILDEPTKVLAPQERAVLFATVAEFRASGYGIVFITHKLNVGSDRRWPIASASCAKGRVVGRAGSRAGTTEAALLALMFEERAPRGGQGERP